MLDFQAVREKRPAPAELVTGLTSDDRAFIRRFLEKRFSTSELQALAFDLGVDYETLSHANKSQLAMELIGYWERRNNLGYLLAEALKQRPDQRLEQILAQWPAAPQRVKLQLETALNQVGVPRLLQYLAERCGTSPNEISLVGIAQDPFRLLLSLPAKAAEQLIQARPSWSDSPYCITEITRFENLDAGSRTAWRGRVIPHRTYWLAFAIIVAGLIGLALLVWSSSPEAMPVTQSFTVHYFDNRPAKSLKPGGVLEIMQHEQVNVQAVIYDQVSAACSWQAIQGTLHTAKGCSITYSAPLAGEADTLTVETSSPRQTVKAYASLHIKIAPVTR
jgi:hypothetical protein